MGRWLLIIPPFGLEFPAVAKIFSLIETLPQFGNVETRREAFRSSLLALIGPSVGHRLRRWREDRNPNFPDLHASGLGAASGNMFLSFANPSDACKRVSKVFECHAVAVITYGNSIDIFINLYVCLRSVCVKSITDELLQCLRKAGIRAFAENPNQIDCRFSRNKSAVAKFHL